ncbi:MarR family transcriptional regulator, 2-MHQ and catechol-resistance regulon repressor [Thermostichus sp. MS-CIW-21]|jgi:DNA-binding MarR family transcriptional regulator|uniref:MarR family winged helix-turn-helix transcriptional regulator n=1 Tax=unclassified Synechococcus TaxID=2626047 RepID=UPI0003070059|nr:MULTISPECIES: MarR family transcriptional regulator [unclassified Synechococcus]PIK87159.1 MarR family transcriptional regulator [Synechococcus sp. 63AY4M2]PIK88079.1 MarR family transcriptional regulator [Synechococcus sp. 65AY6A5]PIK92518.1 MarR family transcriptional regulator [Synechococcus sp. 65AY6Li]PIK96230.1 MarR family transcriptional regulator [Synechococcus sp. 60AY4M2]PIK98453.1 MarR family transcriptional regulator [Synechococcus sp. 63AY4M1]
MPSSAESLSSPLPQGEALKPSVVAAREPFLGLLRDLARAYQAFENYAGAHIRQMGLTAPQFDVLVTLGNTPGLTMNVLAQKTLVTKGTLTGIVDRLEQKGLVRREVPPENRRCFKIVLTEEGEKLFEQVFPAHVAYLKERFQKLDPEEMAQIQACLKKLQSIFHLPRGQTQDC